MRKFVILAVLAASLSISLGLITWLVLWLSRRWAGPAATGV